LFVYFSVLIDLNGLREQVPSDLTHKVIDMSTHCSKYGVANIEESLQGLLQYISVHGGHQNSIITMCGSLFVAAEARECLFE